ncbi:DUF4157 domain-containing protein [Sorangium sp. So ce375]|uniref:eCIS core domain-containing protein n=1 Tax=Sorangium sp. So ce375 TaxID=3133306 RepID=UPI003F5B4BA2
MAARGRSSRSQAATPLPVAGGHTLSIPGRLRRAVERATGASTEGVRAFRGALPAGAPASIAATFGRDCFLSPSAPSLGTLEGDLVMIHEMAHAVAQPRVGPAQAGIAPRGGPAPAGAESEAHHVALATLGLSPPARVRPGPAPYWAPFDDAVHRVIEELALRGVFTEEEIAEIYRGNLMRDMSQVPAIANPALIHEYGDFGGYRPVEHFDNYVWDRSINRFTGRGQGQGDPIEYINDKLEQSMGSAGRPNLVRLGDALHAIEDFFTHSNFLSLIQMSEEERAKHLLITGSFDGHDQLVTFQEKLATYAGDEERRKRTNEDLEKSRLLKPDGHSQLNKDGPHRHGFAQAASLALSTIEGVARLMAAAYRDRGDRGAAHLLEAQRLVAERLRFPEGAPEEGWWAEALTDFNVRRIQEAFRGVDPASNMGPFSVARMLRWAQGPILPLPPFASMHSFRSEAIPGYPMEINLAMGLLTMQKLAPQDPRWKNTPMERTAGVPLVPGWPGGKDDGWPLLGLGLAIQGRF